MRYKRHKTIIFLFIFLYSIITSRASAQEFEFRFNPPDGITYVQTLKVTKIKDAGQLGKQIDVAESKTRIIISKSSLGYSVVATPISMIMKRNGQEVDNPVVPLLKDIIVSYKLDVNGQLIAVHGFETLEKKMKESLSPSLVASFSSILNEKAMIEKETTEYNGRIGNFIGRNAKIGDVWLSTDKYLLPNGEFAVFYSAIEFAEQVKHSSHDCIRMKFTYNTDSDALKNYVEKTLGKIAQVVGDYEERAVVSDIEISGEGERLIDPDTMLIYSETIIRTIKMQMEFPGQGKIMTTTQEKREYSFDYSS